MEYGKLTSRNYPHSYPHLLNHKDTISVSKGKIVITFDSFSTEASYDKVTISDADGTTLLSKYSGTTLPGRITSRTNKVFVTFVTDSSGSSVGWSLKWKSADI